MGGKGGSHGGGNGGRNLPRGRARSAEGLETRFFVQSSLGYFINIGFAKPAGITGFTNFQAELQVARQTREENSCGCEVREGTNSRYVEQVLPCVIVCEAVLHALLSHALRWNASRCD